MQKNYQKIADLFKYELNQVRELVTEDLEFEEPLKSKVLEFLNAPSKHIRPLVSFLYLKMTGGNIDDKQILYQSAIELVHNVSLIHDDVIDESDVRRGIKTINSVSGNKLAVIAGDYLLSKALDKVLLLECPQITAMLSDTLKVMTQGEIAQLACRFKIPNIDEYIKKSAEKTAKLFETAVCGSLLIAKSKFDGDEFAYNFGTAFQIRDDLINCKTVKTDIAEGIYTAPVIFSNSVNINNDGIEKTRSLLNNYIEKAVKAIEKFDDNEYKASLKELLELMKDE